MIITTTPNIEGKKLLITEIAPESHTELARL